MDGGRSTRRATRVGLLLVALVALAAVVAVATPAGEAAKRLVLPKGSVGKVQLRASAVTRPKVAANAIDGTKVRDGSLGSAELAPGSVDGARLADGAVGAADIAAGAVGSAAIAPASVDSARIADGSVGAADLGTVPGSKVDVATLGKVPAAASADALGGTIVVPVDHSQGAASPTPTVVLDRLGNTLSLTCTATTLTVGADVLVGAGASYAVIVPGGGVSGEATGPAGRLQFTTAFPPPGFLVPVAAEIWVSGPLLILHGEFLLDPDGASGCSLRGHVTITPLG